MRADPTRRLCPQIPGYGLKTLIRPGTPGHLLPEGEGTISTFSLGEKVAEGRMRADPTRRLCPQIPGHGLKTLIRPGTPGHLLPKGEGTISTFSHWEKVAEGRMRADPTRRLCPQIPGHGLKTLIRPGTPGHLLPKGEGTISTFSLGEKVAEGRMRADPTRRLCPQIPGHGLKTLIRPGTPGHLLPKGEGTISTFSLGEKVAEGRMRADPTRRLCPQIPGHGLKTLIRPGTPGHLLPKGEGTISTFSHWEKVAEGRMRADPTRRLCPQIPGYGLKTLIRPGTPGHLLPEGEGTIPTFSHWEKVAEGRMRADPTRRLCPQIREVISRSFLSA